MKTPVFAICLLSVVTCSHAQSVDAVLARMDKAAPDFHGMSANVEMVEYKTILDDATHESGTLEMQKPAKGNTRAILTFPDRTIGFLGKVVRIYYTKLNTYQDVAEIGKNGDLINQFLLLGFGVSGQDLAKNYSITMQGTENVSGQDTSKFLLVPKDPDVKQRLAKVVIWIPDTVAYPVQQQFFEPSGNYRKVIYSNITLNPPNQGTLEIKMRPGHRARAKLSSPSHPL